MATIALERAMGQHDQRTLHPFFGKGLKERDLPSSESQPLQPAGPVDKVAPGKDVANILIDSTSGSGSDCSGQSGGRISSRRDRKREGGLQLQLTNNGQRREPALKDDDANASRKKRRKTGTSEHSEHVTEGPLRRLFVKDSPAPSLTEHVDTAAPSEANAADQSTGARSGTDLPVADALSVVSQSPRSSSLVESFPPCLKPVEMSLKPDDPSVNTLKLNQNGKLLNSPLRLKSEFRDPEEQTKNRKSAAQRGGKTQSGALALKYGVNEVSRSSIGQQISEIMDGRKRYRPAKETASIPIPNPPQLPSKPMHPFFLGRAGQKAEENVGQSEDLSTNHPACAQKNLPATTNQLSQQNSQYPQHTSDPSTHKADISKTATTMARSLLPKHPDPLDAIWPPREAVHVRGLSPSNDNHCSFVDFEERKAKGLAVSIPDYENVLYVQSRLFPHVSEWYPKRVVLRTPNKKSCSRDRLLEIVMNGLGLTYVSTERTGKNFPRQRTSMPYTSHPAVAQLLSSVRSSTTAFDRGGFDDYPWTQKYAPSGADSVLQLGTEALVLKRWLQSLTVSIVNTGNSGSDGKQTNQIPDDSAKRKKRRKGPKDLDDFIVSSDDEPQIDEVGTLDDEDELAGGVTVSNKRTVVRSDHPISDSKSASEKRPVTNSILISGPSGCGKTAAVFAVAKELGFEIFEINAGSRRSARDVVERVGDMTQNHLVQLLGQVDENSSAGPSLKSMFSTPNDDSGKQSTMKTFFKQNMNKSGTKTAVAGGCPTSGGNEPVSKAQPSQKQSLILLEEVDILFEEDKQFWSGVLALIGQSRRPIIMTCNDEHLLPLEQLKLHTVLRFHQPPCDLATDYLFLLAANEGHILDRERIAELYTVMRQDLRATIMQLNFWCQMSVGSKKSGLDWLTTRPFLCGGPEHEASLAKIMSTDTYVHGMGLVCQDLVCEEDDSHKRRSQLMHECLSQWQMGLMDWHESKIYRGEDLGHDGESRLEALTQNSRAADMMANLDIICRGSPDEFTDDVFDPSSPEMTGKQRSTYTEGYQLLQADPLVDYTCLSTKIGISMTILLGNSFHGSSPSSDEDTIIEQALQKFSSHKPIYPTRSELRDTFEPIMENPDPFNPPSGRQSFSFDNGRAPISEDLAPYIRAIVAFDLRLEQQRLVLSGSISHNTKSSKRIRTTRASRAALEGGDKASIRKDRWFTGKLNSRSVLATGGLEWQHVLGLGIQRTSVGQHPRDERGDHSTDEHCTMSSNEGGI
ncbi:hypothetical protein AJ78_01701 [Emergomyces pasteurianus Ep9510]|uniref:ATPase AAA-type core domain-containing protein n=1 Tax=Emergomyces pasteurianus Ep9510 TaxID=1447872 RepID=A0A1J9PQ07_9EURO|nr:hypothetical protein AJ78_01701 [Emergomyces pasteurianus Ep9510]